MKRQQSGFSIIEVLIIIIVLGVIGFVGWEVLGNKKEDALKTATNNTQNSNSNTTADAKSPQKLIWQQTADGWQATETAPACSEQPMLKVPVNLKGVTSILYPGQTRGGNYKPHGGFRFDNASENKVDVAAPIDGFIVRGSRYLEEGTNEVQYTFDIMNNCGIMYRVGHLRELPDNLQKIADSFPEATSSSATQSVNPAVFIQQGERLAIKVGTLKDGNTFFDLGVYDYRQENRASESPEYQAAHPQKELAWHAVCWLRDWLPENDTASIAQLPAGDPASGKSSDYC